MTSRYDAAVQDVIAAVKTHGKARTVFNEKGWEAAERVYEMVNGLGAHSRPYSQTEVAKATGLSRPQVRLYVTIWSRFGSQRATLSYMEAECKLMIRSVVVRGESIEDAAADTIRSLSANREYRRKVFDAFGVVDPLDRDLFPEDDDEVVSPRRVVDDEPSADTSDQPAEEPAEEPALADDVPSPTEEEIAAHKAKQNLERAEGARQGLHEALSDLRNLRRESRRCESIADRINRASDEGVLLAHIAEETWNLYEEVARNVAKLHSAEPIGSERRKQRRQHMAA